METKKVKAIVLKSQDLKDKDKLLTLYSLEEGKIQVVMRGVRGEKAKMRFAKERFCFGEYVLEPTKAGLIVTQVEIIESFFALTKDINKFYEGCAILDVIDKIATGSEPALFVETIKALKSLTYQNINKYYVFDRFLLRIFAFSGYNLVKNKCVCGGDLSLNRYFNFSFGEFKCVRCKNTDCEKVSNATFHAVQLLNQLEYEKLENLKLGGNAEIEIYNLMRKNFEARFGAKLIEIV